MRDWTSANSAIQVIFKRTPVPRAERTSNFKFIFMVRVYSQDCLNCGRVGDFKNYDIERKYLTDHVVKRIMKKYFKDEIMMGEKKQKSSNMGETHQRNLCAACKKGVCPFKPRTNDPDAL